MRDSFREGQGPRARPSPKRGGRSPLVAEPVIVIFLQGMSWVSFLLLYSSCDAFSISTSSSSKTSFGRNTCCDNRRRLGTTTSTRTSYPGLGLHSQNLPPLNYHVLSVALHPTHDLPSSFSSQQDPPRVHVPSPRRKKKSSHQAQEAVSFGPSPPHPLTTTVGSPVMRPPTSSRSAPSSTSLSGYEALEENVALALEEMLTLASQRQQAIKAQEKALLKQTSALSTTTSGNDGLSPSPSMTPETISAPRVTTTSLFPTVRECNAALAAWGDAGDLLRALRLFGKMRKASTLQHQLIQQQQQFEQLWLTPPNPSLDLPTPPPFFATGAPDGGWPGPVPAPTLVTYSTLMSRAVKASQPRVALRLWNMMRHPPVSSQHHMIRQVDVKAANILMNVYAKLGEVSRAENLLVQMKTGQGPDITHVLTPNLITYNTLLDACHKAGDLDAGWAVLQDMRQRPDLIPDARTYTSLMATVARGKSLMAGAHDPTPAFMLLQEMQEQGIRPNGMTYSALIDACGRCGRSDLALQGLRIMLRQKAQEKQSLNGTKDQPSNSQQKGTGSTGTNRKRRKSDADDWNYSWSNEVGAWTAAINACGKAGRLETAVKLFYAMPNFGVQPNTVTCGCLMDSLLRAGRTAETLEVLRFMKQQGIAPSEVMYTSLMTRAEVLVKQEHKKLYGRRDPEEMGEDDKQKDDESGGTKAIEVYTELMRSLMSDQPEPSYGGAKSPQASYTNQDDTLLLKVFLVFQEMKARGATPDLACFNALLRACARAGDLERAQDVLRQMEQAELDPNDTSWRQLIHAASKQRRSDLAEAIWRQGLAHRPLRAFREGAASEWQPSVDSWTALLGAYHRHATAPDTTPAEKERLLHRMIALYRAIPTNKAHGGLSSSSMGMERVDRQSVQESSRAMLLILQAVVAAEKIVNQAKQPKMRQGQSELKEELRALGVSIVNMNCLKELHSASPRKWGWSAESALQKAQSW